MAAFGGFILEDGKFFFFFTLGVLLDKSIKDLCYALFIDLSLLEICALYFLLVIRSRVYMLQYTICNFRFLFLLGFRFVVHG